MNCKIGIITCWYGPYPWYFSYFIHSCSYNPTIDFIIITDNQGQISNKPKNVKIIHKKLEEIKLIAFEKLGFNVRIDTAYKLCDFKPAYGFLFPEIVKKYDFWGHADIDMVYGNIRNFIVDEVLQNYDVISVRNEYITGFFALYRNSGIVNTLFKKSKDYRYVFENTKNFSFDECNFLCDSLMDGISIYDLAVEIESMTHVVKRLDIKEIIRTYFDLHIVESTPGNLEWNNGRLFYKSEYEIMLYHLISFKVHPLLQIPEWIEIPAKYYINEYSFSQ